MADEHKRVGPPAVCSAIQRRAERDVPACRYDRRCARRALLGARASVRSSTISRSGRHAGGIGETTIATPAQPPDLDRVLEVAIAATRRGAAALRRPATRQAAKGGDPVNVVTDRDLAAQRAIFALLREAYPSHRFIGEEEPVEPIDPSDGPVWIVDPLDGTSNFARQHTPFGVSVGFALDGRTMVGAIAAPTSGALAWAVRGKGAFYRRAGRTARLAVSDTARLDRAMVLTGYGYRREGYAAWLARFGRAVYAAQAVRMSGSAVNDLIAVARGVVDVFWEDELQIWDFAAGALLVEEAGGRVTGLDGGALPWAPGPFLATNGRVHDEMLRFLAD